MDHNVDCGMPHAPSQFILQAGSTAGSDIIMRASYHLKTLVKRKNKLVISADYMSLRDFII